MDPRFSSALFLILSCLLWNAECRNHNQILKVTNGGEFGEWGEIAMCSNGYANGFSLKVQPYQGIRKDDSALTGIRLHCEDGTTQESTTGDIGDWRKVVKCSSGNLMSFSLQVERYVGMFDDTSANNIKFTCQDEKVLKGNSPTNMGLFGEWSDSCKVGAICGIKTKVEPYSLKLSDNTGLNDVQFFCCD